MFPLETLTLKGGLSLSQNNINGDIIAEEHGDRESFPDDPAKKLENHIMGESFHLDDIDIDKIHRQEEELETLKHTQS